MADKQRFEVKTAQFGMEPFIHSKPVFFVSPARSGYLVWDQLGNHFGNLFGKYIKTIHSKLF